MTYQEVIAVFERYRHIVEMAYDLDVSAEEFLRLFPELCDGFAEPPKFTRPHWRKRALIFFRRWPHLKDTVEEDIDEATYEGDGWFGSSRWNSDEEDREADDWQRWSPPPPSHALLEEERDYLFYDIINRDKISPPPTDEDIARMRQRMAEIEEELGP